MFYNCNLYEGYYKSFKYYIGTNWQLPTASLYQTTNDMIMIYES